MATSSFDEMMVIDTPEKARNLEAAFWAAEKRGPLEFDGIDIVEDLRRGREFLRNNPNFLNEAGAAAMARLAERGELPDTDE